MDETLDAPKDVRSDKVDPPLTVVKRSQFPPPGWDKRARADGRAARAIG